MNRLEELLAQLVRDRYGHDVDVVLTRPDAQFGDASTNVAMQLAKPLGRAPRDIAEELKGMLANEADVASAEVAGPGFLNIRFSTELLNQEMRRVADKVYDGTNVVLEYSCPNAFKELHTGHLYQTIFGDILARLLEKTGATVNRTSFGGDVGLHVAKCLYGMQLMLADAEPSTLDEVDSSPFVRAHWISQCYVRGAGAYEQDSAAKDRIDELNREVYALHEDNDHESALAQLYWTTRQWSFDYFTAFYGLIDVDAMRYYPESQTAPVGMNIVKEELARGNLKESDGAVVFEGDESQHLHTRVFITSRGLPTYETKDIGVIRLEQDDYHFDKRILITGNDQREYMRVVFAAADTFQPGLADKMTHLTNGTVRFGDGTKMSSRLGNVTRAIDVLDIVREKVKELVEDETLVEAVTLGAIKYVFARYRIGGDIAFDLEETVSLQGNSGPYLQYAHARARSILTKATAGKSADASYVYNDDERQLVAKLGEYAGVVERAATELAPHHVCNYLFELAQEFNRFYEHNRVIGEAEEANRIVLVERYADTLQDGLGILGIVALHRM
jgi:arginyl-tRNA synthetase